MRTWLVAHDFSPCADAAARVGVRDLLDKGEAASLVLLHVYQVMPMPAGLDGSIGGAGLVTLERAVADESGRRLERVAEAVRRYADEVRAARPSAASLTVTVAVRADAPAEGILAEARERAVERICVGTHGRTGLSHLLMGSVAERVVRLAPMPVLVVKEPQ